MFFGGFQKKILGEGKKYWGWGLKKNRLGAGGRTNERPVTDHVILGAMRGLEKNATDGEKKNKK